MQIALTIIAAYCAVSVIVALPLAYALGRIKQTDKHISADLARIQHENAEAATQLDELHRLYYPAHV